MGKELTIVAIVGAFIFGMWYFNKNGCETDMEALCWNGPSLEEMFGGAGKGSTETEMEEVEEADERNDIRQITPPEKRGIISRTQTSDPVSTGGGVGGSIDPDDYKSSAWAHSYFINNRISIA